ncbi:hypothetical protein LPH50_03195 [Xylella taiwanensis]|uniref:Uncharacterized protein n=1 Tax=Xylella taiwanensis TaxID=1444770 RepID=Z9JLP2_9GAMM|nr:hypothetical protein [Xylella taiwanensis]EWS79064.1 hypothetical protein AF72_02010 [Xylella taiwanensis]MCD8457247.1 hypothetical protein [Xylella taiwanensis]MCD8459657.1 hypothetical protein [Xylella taiwanensis]MCD8461476.1 hypothetical protein [Xylella taiwanensis]MCD8462497.1 hypothetical protein [Xylella taiwanensis]
MSLLSASPHGVALGWWTLGCFQCGHGGVMLVAERLFEWLRSGVVEIEMMG